MLERARGAADARRIRAAILAAIHAYAGAPDGSLRLVTVKRVGGGDQWRTAGRQELMDGRARIDRGRLG